MLLFLIMLPRCMSETAAIRIDLTVPAGLLIIKLYSLVTGIKAFIKPPIIKIDENINIKLNRHEAKVLSPIYSFIFL